MDVITCGMCYGEFPLSDIMYFIHHKAVECRRSLYRDKYGQNRALVCCSCSCLFKTAWSLLRHIQDNHNLKLYVEDISHEEPVQVQANNSPGRDKFSSTHNHSSDSQCAHREAGHPNDNSCLMVNSPDSYQCRANIGEWEENCSKSPVISPRSKYPGMVTNVDQGHIPFHGIPEERSDVPFLGSPVMFPEETDPLPLDLKISHPHNGSFCSDPYSDSENSCSSSANRSHPVCQDNHSIDFQASILPKKRKWSHVEHGVSANKTVPRVSRSSSLVENKVSAFFKDSEPSKDTVYNKPSNHNRSVAFIPKWKYSMDLRSSLPLLVRADDRPLIRSSEMVVSGVIENGCPSPPSHHQSDCEDPRDSLASPGFVTVDYTDSPLTNLDDHSVQTSPVRSSPCDENLPPQVSVETLDIAPQDHTSALLHSAGIIGNIKKRRYPTTRPFKCDHCDHSFNQRIHLKKHLSKHTGIKPFKCSLCDYSTVERSHLKVHVRIHTGEKPYKCTFCDYATAQNSTLKIHLKRHHDGQMFKCKTCLKSFTQLSMLNCHMKNHMHSSHCDHDQLSTHTTPLLLAPAPNNVASLA